VAGEFFARRSMPAGCSLLLTTDCLDARRFWAVKRLWRIQDVTAGDRSGTPSRCSRGGSPERRGASCGKPSRAGEYQWAELTRRTFGVDDVLACPRCGGQLRLVALIDRASVVQRIRRYLGLPTDLPEPRPARAPPLAVDATDDQFQDAAEFDAAW
jgi:hypothetical protein